MTISLKRNVGNIDRIIRMIIGIALITSGFLGVFENQLIVALVYLIGLSQIVESILSY
ncbi:MULTISPECIES: YgaP family membrane protein [unclassified Candidatus Frackibacter]|uniref:YgaP family membrane protein n=1 Tax=unclassified Candidatus Frackibacter TaxID=2648818 RepID=UPI000795BE8E|nr:MAG: hypothetical protein AWU54_953 [Candidatus Frackibacter sp. T328-2]SDC20484.1 Protein of unknown function [Candidatus Frackibacter sp. WG11]SEM51205.1 Protein of unknown function [Candidatus Frackibacter sp. WG12]SFL52455.1 Protein of unknown function [Candidatus Frackibacter sp. WG13]